jgi:hypothetical protein
MEDKMSIFEEFHTKGSLTESVKIDKKDYFVSLFNMSAPLSKGKKYIVVPLSLVGNRILPLDTPSIAEFVAQSNDGLTFNTRLGKRTYPSKIMRDLSIFNTFTFSSMDKYDKFRTALSLKFDISLPGVGNSKQQGMAEAEQQKGADYRDPPEADYDDDYQAMVKRMKQLAGTGPLKTVHDPAKRVYKNIPTAVQPKTQPRK